VVEVVEIRAANATGLDADGHLAGPERLDPALLDPEVAGRVDDDAAHGAIS
jgi:hypothetical protein